ncbi:hypothetical protein ACT8ZV_12030 [Nocardioides sp. MAHUQ-72]|uniref:hypothetical protein n=1 Tax=unclassified Nocardioides TaxID=2615069 RepID=UPI00360CA8F7
MPRRVSLPAADDLFRPTVKNPDPSAAPASPPAAGQPPTESAVRAVPDQPEPTEHAPSTRNRGRAPRKPSGRVRHDEKMTVYVTSDELLDLEHARLSLRRSHGLAVDRGRLVREAVALVLADFEANGDDSVLVRRLTQE